MDVVKRPVPRSAAWSQRLHGVSPPRKWRERTGNARGAGTRSFVWVAEVGSTHRASSSPGGRKTCWWQKRALAWRKSVAPPDAGRGWVEGETVRVRESIQKVLITSGLQVSKLAASRHDGRCSWAFARLALTGGSKHGPQAPRSTSFIFTTERSGFRRPAHRTESESGSGVPAGDNGTSEVDTVR
jgi:hypothetical protein